MAKFGEIVAYMFNADLYCAECVVKQVLATTNLAPSTREFAVHILDQATTEWQLDNLALHLMVNREDEATFDSGEFPKVVLFDNLHDQGRTFNCGDCGRELEN